jgi:RimJ/RimL family protein N-acetyltransferase
VTRRDITNDDSQWLGTLRMRHPATGSGLVVGDLGLHRPPRDGTVEIGFGLAESARGHGYAAEALTELTRWAFTQPGVSRITARTAPSNIPSQRVPGRAGFRHERTQDDVLHYAVLPPRHRGRPGATGHGQVIPGSSAARRG